MGHEWTESNVYAYTRLPLIPLAYPLVHSATPLAQVGKDPKCMEMYDKAVNVLCDQGKHAETAKVHTVTIASIPMVSSYVDCDVADVSTNGRTERKRR